jgi:hypothetical protein
VKQKLTLLIYIVCWERYQVTETVFQQVMNLQAKLKDLFYIQPLAVISEPQLQDLCQDYLIPFTAQPNLPVGRKHNLGLKAALNMNWDYLIQCGSNNLLSEKLFQDHYAKLIESQEPYFGIKNCYFYNVFNHQLKYHVSDRLFGGAGRAIRRDLVEEFDRFVTCEYIMSRSGTGFSYKRGELVDVHETLFNPELMRIKRKAPFQMWENHRNRGLDSSSHTRILRFTGEYKHIEVNEPLAVDIKSDTNMVRFEDYAGDIQDSNILLKYFDQSIVRQLELACAEDPEEIIS